MDREDAYSLMCEYTTNGSLRQHMLAVEVCMRHYAEHGEQDVEKWGVVGLLHDFDYERWPDPPDHPLKGSEILADRGYPEDVIYAIKSHADYLEDCPRVSAMDKTLYACDELAGFIAAVAKVRPDGMQGMKPKSVRKKLKQKSFAAAVNREDIVNGAEDLGVELNEHIQFMIDAMTSIENELGLSTSGDTRVPLHKHEGKQIMEIQATEQLLAKKCEPCEGGVEPYSLEESQQQLGELAGWKLTADNQRIRKEWTVTNFMAGMDFFNRVAEVAEDDGHHPDLHIAGYRNVAIELWTHAIGGLSENDFILAAKIDQLEIELQ